MPNKIKKILTVDDLIKFCQEQKFMKFDSQDTGYQIAIKVPTVFELENETDDNHRGMLKLKIKIFHTLLNRNKSFISKESAEKAMKTIPDRPVLAALHQLESGEWDFAGHEAEIVEDENGNEEFKYIESQVGSFSSEPAFWEHDNELDKDFVCAYAYISREYTKACEVLERKNGTKNSCELCVDKFNYNAKEKYLELEDFYVSGSTLLGCTINGEIEIQEGMQGSRADIVDFSVENNSVKFNKDEKLVEILDRLNETLSKFNINNNNSKEGGKSEKMTKFEELLAKYNKTVDDITFEYESLSEDELTEKFEELFGKCGDDDKKEKCEEDPEDKPDNDTNEPSEDSTDDEPLDNDDEPEDSDDNTDDDTVKEDNACGGGSGSKKKKNNSQDENITRTYELSHDDIRCALYNLLAPYEETDNDYYWIMEVFDSYFVYQGCTGKVYGQKYSKDGDNVAFDGERYELFMEYLTESEKTELESMRSNYSSISEKLAQYEEAEEIADKMTVFSDEAYSNYLDTDEFKSLMAKDTLKKFTKDELVEKADAALGKLNRTHQSFSMNTNKTEDKKENKTPSFLAFAKIEHESSFLDGLLKK